MRPTPPLLLLAALVLAACGSSDRRSSSEPGAARSTSRGPDPVLLRIPLAGGRVSAAVYPNVDSVVWRSGQPAPALARVLAFDVESGQLAAVDRAGLPVRVDLRLGTVTVASRTPLQGLTSVDGGTFFGVGADGAVVRLTPSGDAWKLAPKGPVQALYPQRDGSVLAAGARAGTGYVWLLRPPIARISDSARVAGGTAPVRTGATDRVYFAAAEQLAGLRARDLQAVATITLDAPARAVAATPSGDRLYVATAKGGVLDVVDQYKERVAGSIELPGAVRELRMDALGRYLLARPASGDSAWVVALGTDRVIGSVRGAWREDLPAVLPDGAIAVAQGNDVVFVDGETLRPRRTVAAGASDFWHLILWNGFRPRAAGLDQPVTFGGGRGDSAVADTTRVDSVRADSAAAPDTMVRPDTTAPRVPRPTVPPPSGATTFSQESTGEVSFRQAALPRVAGRGYTLQLGAAPSERDARSIAARAKVPGMGVRVVPGTRGGRPLFRVVAGPFPTRADAERAGRASGLSYWVYQGAP